MGAIRLGDWMFSEAQVVLREQGVPAEVVRSWAPDARARVLALANIADLADPDVRTPGQRKKANAEALEALTGACCNKEDRRALRRYTGWGGLSLRDIPPLPPWLPVRPEELIHTYYSPTPLAFDLCTLLRTLVYDLKVARGRTLQALEPSAGVGRFMTPWALDGSWIEWTAVELDKMSFSILERLFPNATTRNEPFEVFPRVPAFDLVIANPPYGPRNELKVRDPKGRKHSRNQDYFVDKIIDVLLPGGLAVLLIPAGFTDGSSYKTFRESVFQRARLLAAWRLPASLFPGALLSIDLLVLRRRSQDGLDADDEAVVAGRYYDAREQQILGVLKPGPHGNIIDGPYKGLPAPAWRVDLAVGKATPMEVSAENTGDRGLNRGLELVARVGRVLATGSAGSSELAEDLRAWRSMYPRLADDLPDDLALLADAETAIAGREQETRPWEDPNAIGEQARHLLRTEGSLTIERLHTFHRQQGGRLEAGPLRTRLFADGWGVEGDSFEQLVPPEGFWVGDLWARVDALELSTDAEISALVQRLYVKIAPFTFSQIPQPVPSDPWVPLDILSAWVEAVSRSSQPVTVYRVDGKLQSASNPGRHVVGWLNADSVAWGVEEKDRPKAEQALRSSWDSFWARLDRTQREIVEHAFNRSQRGFVDPPPDRAPKPIARWGSRSLHDYQWEAVNQMVRQRTGGLFADVGLGKTTMALAFLALARQQGWARRAIIVVPVSLLQNWIEEIGVCLPDYRVGIVGQRQTKTGTWRVDDEAERAEVWQQMQAGVIDVVIVTETSVILTEISVEDVTHLANLDALRYQAAKDASGRKRTERQEVATEAAFKGWVAGELTVQENRKPDKLRFLDLGIELIIRDEAHRDRKAFTPSPRFGRIPDFMGGSTSAKRAWQMWFRYQLTPYKLLLSATPAVNSPIEYYTILTGLDETLLQRAAGVSSVLEFEDAFLRFEQRLKETPRDVEYRDACVGWASLPRIRTLLRRIAWVGTAKSVGLPLPVAGAQRVSVDPDLPTRQRLDEIIEEMEEAAAEREWGTVLGAFERLTLAGIHPSLGGAKLDDEGEVIGSLSVSDDELASPKLIALEHRIREDGCGHVVFCNSVMAGRLAARYLTLKGWRVGLINAKDTQSSTARQNVAKALNARELDVVVGNAVAEEGLNLQMNCAVHHLDCPWSPAQLHQRNGRVVRQGSKRDTVAIYYYAITGGADLIRWQAVNGKSGWLSQMAEIDADTSNPAAAVSTSPLEIIASLSKDPKKYETMLAEQRLNAKVVREDVARDDAIHQARAYIERLQKCGDERERCLAEASELVPKINPDWVDVDRLIQVDPAADPWVSEDGQIWEVGSWAMWRGDQKIIQLGRRVDSSLGIREAGSATWSPMAVMSAFRNTVERAAVMRLILVGGGGWRDGRRLVYVDSPDDPIDASAVASSPILAFGWSPDRWARQWWTDEFKRQAIAEHQYTAFPIYRDGRIVLTPPRNFTAEDRLVPTYEWTTFADSPAAIADGAQARARGYFHREPDERFGDDGAYRWAWAVLPLYDGRYQDLEDELGVGGTRLRQIVGRGGPWAGLAEAAELLAEASPPEILKDELRIPLRSGQRYVSPFPGRDFVAGDGVLKVEAERVLGRAFPVDDAGRLAAWLADLALRRLPWRSLSFAWGVEQARALAPNGLAAMVLRLPNRRLVALVATSPRPIETARQTVLWYEEVADRFTGLARAVERARSLPPPATGAASQILLPRQALARAATLASVMETPVMLQTQPLAVALRTAATTVYVALEGKAEGQPRAVELDLTDLMRFASEPKILVADGVLAAGRITATGRPVEPVIPPKERDWKTLRGAWQDLRTLRKVEQLVFGPEGMMARGINGTILIRGELDVEPLRVGVNAEIIGALLGDVIVGRQIDDWFWFSDGVRQVARLSSAEAVPAIPSVPGAVVRVPVVELNKAVKPTGWKKIRAVDDKLEIGDTVVQGEGEASFAVEPTATSVRMAVRELGASHVDVGVSRGALYLGTEAVRIWLA